MKSRMKSDLSECRQFEVTEVIFSPNFFPVTLENSHFLSESSQTCTEPEDITGGGISDIGFTIRDARG